VSSNDFNGSQRPARGRGTDAGKYPEPEGWGQDGFWRDPSIDSDYETGTTSAIRPRRGGSSDSGTPGYSYWADGKGWENAPGSPPPGSAASGLTASGAPGGAAGNGSAGGGSRNGNGGYGSGGDPTAYYGAAAGGYGPGGPGGPGRPGGPGGPRHGGPGGPRGRSGGKVKGSWWRRWTWKKVVGLVGAMAGFFILLGVGAYFYAYSSTTIPTQLAANVLDQNSTVYYSDGKTPIGSIGLVNRHLLTYSQIPMQVQDAVLAAEDRGFWTEGGISPTGILRAAYDDVTSSGGNLSGGSTITQEFVRQYYNNIGTAQTASRKIKEIFIAQKLAKSKSKQWILTNYLNTIFLGDNSYGISAAAQTYFGVPVSKLTYAQAAVIAAIIQQPSNFPQPQYRPNLTARWHYVLNGMVQMKDITQAQADAMQFPKMLTDTKASATRQAAGTTSSSDPWAQYLMNVVYNELTSPISVGGDGVPVTTLETGGLKIITTISRPMEVEMYHAVNENIAAIKASGYSLPSYALIGAELQNPNTGAIVGMYPGRGQNMSASQCKIYDCQLNTAIYTREQVGSSFKPYVLAAAVSQGMNVQSSILNASPTLYVPPETDPLVLSTTDPTKAMPESFKVSNDGGEVLSNKPGGAITVQNALAQSSNTAYTDLAHRVGTENIIQMAANMGVNIQAFPAGSNLSQLKGQVGMALGTGSLTVNEQATMLSTIDNGGTYHQAHVIQSWQAPEGTVHLPVVAMHQVLSQALDSQVQYAMEMTTVDGTGTAASLGPDRPIIGKTGTTTNSKSAFFIGAIPQWTFAVGIFTQQQNPNSPQTLTALGGGGFGGTWPAAIWHTFMSEEFGNLPVQQFLNPVFTGAKWDQVGKVPTKKKPKRQPTPTQTPKCKHPFGFGCPTPSGSTSPTPTATIPTGLPTTPTPTGTTTTSGGGGGGG
jgi:membrane peptidoglycan carboxypeptidase